MQSNTDPRDSLLGETRPEPFQPTKSYPEPPRPAKPRNLYNAYPIKVTVESRQGNDLWKWGKGA